MPNPLAAPALATLLALPAASAPPKPSPALAPLNAAYPDLERLYIDLHQSPELSLHEEKTSAKIADRLRALGYEVTDHVGGFGVVGVMRNGKGPTVLLRADMDALPIEERTGLPYASKVTAKDASGATVPVMHACGHDIHMTSLVGAATLLAKAKSRWKGTVVLVGQPAEELGGGASRMLKDRFMERFPKPDYAISLHDDARLPAGEVGFTPGYMWANVDSVDITVYGRGGHGARPEGTVDPIVIAARIVTALQTIVARENSPFDPAVVTVGSIHGGTKHNIIPDEVKMQLTVRSYEPAVRKKLLAAIERVAKAEAAAGAAPREPLVVVDADGGDAVYNDPALTRRVAGAIAAVLGASNVREMPRVMAGEDFGEWGVAAKCPSTDLWLGATPPAKLAAVGGDATKVPGIHSSEFAPDREPTIKTGAAALTLAALEVLGK
ncbi:MAG TPA: amidohydrolase [Thermoanaerobaculia bacterium]|jgi:hippurate hydrolase|nr:amidohydrolase [Thermoanaerobaculia bacterium]